MRHLAAKLHHELSRRNIRRALTGARGAIDLASIMVGVLVIGIIGGVISATVFSVIPWSQDQAARGGLDAVRTAQSVAKVQGGKFLDLDGLTTGAQPLLQETNTVAIGTDVDGTCYISLAKSGSGKLYFGSSKGPDVAELTESTPDSATNWCTDISTLVTDLGSTPAAGGGIVDGAVTLPGWGSIDMMKTADDGTTTTIRVFVNTMNAAQDANEPSTTFTNLPFLQTAAATPISGFTAALTDVHLLVGGQDIVVTPGATIIGYMDAPNIVHNLEFPSIQVPTSSLPALWSDWNGATLMFKIDGVQQALVMDQPAWADADPRL